MHKPPNGHEHKARPAPTDSGSAGIAYLFGPFRLIPSQQRLLEGDVRVLIGGRALDLLTALVERGGEVVSKTELMARAWPHTVVDEGSLKVHVAALRKALGEGPAKQRYVATVVGRGYRFVAPVEREWISSAGAPSPVSHNIPAALVRPIGRAAVIQNLIGNLTRTRLLTIAGPGGIGKTTVALAVAHEMLRTGAHDVWFVNLSRLADARFVPHAVANAIGLTVHSDDIAQALTHYFRLQKRPQLVVLDSCEHVIEAAAVIAECMTAAAAHMRVLATSREPLHALGEHVYRLDPLDTPPERDRLTMDEALGYSAVELFVERALAARGGFAMSDDEAPVVAQICRRLDGIALAIELAATRSDAFGVHELLDLLDDRFATLASGRRTAPERHRTLLATLEWSHQLLPENERVVLRRLGVFPGAFSLGAAEDIVGNDVLTHDCLIEAIASLVAKSLLSANLGHDAVRYRLLDTMRDYARRKLAEAGETDYVARRHAEHFHALYARVEGQWNGPPDARWLDDHLSTIDDIRAALNWAFSESGDNLLGVLLTVSAIPAWVRLSSLEECRGRVAFALQHIPAEPPELDRERMKLNAALAASALYTRGMVAQVEAAWTTALAIAERLDDTEYRLRALFVACCGFVYSGQHRAADELLRKFRAIADASGNEICISDGNRLTAFAWHHMGKQRSARQLLESALEWYASAFYRSQVADNHVKGREGTRSLMASVLWFQGCFDQARAQARQALDDAQASGHSLTIGYVLVFAFIPLALHAGELHAAGGALVTLQQNVAKHGLILFDAMTRGLHGALLLERNDPAGLPLLADALAQLERDHIGMRYSMFAAIHSRGLLRFGHLAQARSTVETAQEWSKSRDELWCMPELLRVEGEIHAASGAYEASATCYLQALDMAREQGALFLELRAANSLARLRLAQGDNGAAQALLSSVCARITEGRDTADYTQAQALLMHLHAKP